MDFKKEYQLSNTLLAAASKKANDAFSFFHPHTATHKSGGELVTPTDISINEFIITEINKAFPNDSITSEEGKKIIGTTNRTWYIDPIDGTTNFTIGFPEFCICIGLAIDTVPTFGSLSVPAHSAIYTADTQSSTFLCNNKAISLQKSSTTTPTVLVCGGHTPSGKKLLPQIVKLLTQQQNRIRMIASAGIELTAVATNTADSCIMTSIRDWDAIAGVVLVRAAGGAAHNATGAPWKPGDHTLIATSAYCRIDIKNILQKFTA